MEILPIETYTPPPVVRSGQEDQDRTEETERSEESEDRQRIENEQQTEETPPPEEGGRAGNVDTYA